MKSNKASIGHARSRVMTSLKLLLLVLCTMFGLTAGQASTDYGPAIWRPCYSTHKYTSGNGHKFHVIHDMEGYYLSTISYFQRSTTQASVHYFTNGKKDYGSDANPGEVSQGVRDSYYAWHARCWNTHSTGTEHEGFAGNPAWYTEAQYVASAGITKHLKARFGWAMDRNHVIAHGQKSRAGWPSYASAHLGIDPYCNDHTDPGPSWNWTHYMDLCTDSVSTPSAPSTLTVTVVSSSQLNLKWVDHSGIETGFKVERATASGGPFNQIGTTAANDVTFSATGLSSGTRYYFRVRAYNASGNSPFSNTANATTKDTIPAAPSSLTATASNDDAINLVWACSAPNEDGFKIFRSLDNVTFAQVGTAGINATTFSNTGLAGNTKYYYKVVSYNTAGNSAFSPVANDTTAPVAPSALTATSGGSYSTINLSWTDNSNNEVGYKIERGTALAGPFTAIATNAAGDATFTDTGRAASTTYYYRVRTFNANGNSLYSNVASFTTPNAPPVLGAIGDKTVAANFPLAFTATATDPNSVVTTTTWQTFESFPHLAPMESVLFNRPQNSATTSAFQDTSTNYTLIRTNQPTGNGSAKTLKAGWGFKTGFTDYWVRLNTFNVPTNMNPTVGLDQIVRFKVHSSKAIKVGIGIRETGTAAAYGANGGTTGDIEWVGVTNVVSGKPVPSRLVPANTWTTLTFNIPFEPTAGFTGDGIVPQTGKGTLEHIVLRGEGGTGAYAVYFDDFAVVAQNTLSYTLDAGAPAGASIGRKTGKFAWTPTSGQVGLYNVTVRVTDQLGAVDFETIKVTVTGTGNNPPVLSAIGAKTVNEGSALTFTAVATDPDAGQTKTFSLDAGAPAGASIGSSSGAFTWTPTEAQGPGTFPITVRVTDNGSPASNDFETVTVTVKEINVAPTLAVISDQTINEGSPLNITASATDADLPANALTYSLASGSPAGMTINPSSGAISWTTGEAQGPDVYPVTVVVKDNGVPVLSASRSFNVTVNEVNVAPVVTVGTSTTTVINFADFDELDPEAANGTVFFRAPVYSSTTLVHLNSSPNTILIETNYPDIDVNTSAQVLQTSFSFKTGTTNPWIRLTTYSSTPTNATGGYIIANPTLDLGQRVRFKMWTDKSMKVGLGIRETGTGAAIGANGGYTGTIEWVGVPSMTGSTPNPSRIVTASNWTTLEFNLPTEAVSTFTGNGVLASGKGVLESLALVPNGGLGTYNVSFDDFEVITISTNLIVDTDATITITNSATDADTPANNWTFSLDAGAPEGAEIDPLSGVFTWTPTPAQSPSTNVITVRATDDGVPPLSGTATLTVIVHKVNTAPGLEGLPDNAIEAPSGQVVSFTATGIDDDIPADTLTFSLVGTIPSGAAIDPVTGEFTWAPPNGNSTNTITVRVTDNGVPNLYDEQNVTILVVPTNAAPVLSLGVARATEAAVNFESFANGTPNESVMFNKPANSSTTVAYIDTAATNYTTVTTNFPAGHASAKVMKIGWTFKTGMSNYWVRLNTYNVPSLPNPTINFSARFKFDVYTTKSLKVGVGCRETATSAAIGANGGVTGNIEYVGVSAEIGTTPIPTRTVNASNWTTLEFDLPNEPAQSLTGNGVLAAGKGTLEHLILLGNGGTGAYTVYVDNFEVVTTTALPGTVTMNANSILTLTATATDADIPAQVVSFGLDADANTNAVLDRVTGAFIWTPGAGDAGTTNDFTINAEDDPTNGAIPKSDEKTFTVIVTADPYGVQATDGQGLVASGETVTLSWDAVAGQTYLVQYKDSLDDADWKDLGTVTADSATGSTVVSSESQRYYRIVPTDGNSSASAE